MKSPNITPGAWSLYDPATRHNPTTENRIMVVHPDGERILACYSTGTTSAKGPIPEAERLANATAMASLPLLLSTLETIFANAAESPEWIRHRILPALKDAGYTETEHEETLT